MGDSTQSPGYTCKDLAERHGASAGTAHSPRPRPRRGHYPNTKSHAPQDSSLYLKRVLASLIQKGNERFLN